ncbi:MAG TPA: hypothetical protein PKU85_03815 [Bacteroidales bacterium]|nr:MAG: hypothetical protein BWX62_00579 [Bacteroidetes bacterium ADurb.Bin037]HPV88320.1 hypothetical protein [Bacteroidales bacterium]HPW78964.1 hypothetical protein [Bacteroidales bacterium]HQB56491.1 hypothetical protein [Bacteroidales bacterium]
MKTEKTLNEKESLDLIARMIDNVHMKIEKNAAIPMIVFGYVSMIISLSVWVALRMTGNNLYNLLWAAIPVLGWILCGLINRNRVRTEGVSRSHMEVLISRLWILLSVVVLLCMIVTFILQGNFPSFFIIILLLTIGVTLSGLMVLYRPFIICGILGILLSFLFLWVKGLESILLIGAVFAIIMVIPGHMLHYAAAKKYKSNV